VDYVCVGEVTKVRFQLTKVRISTKKALRKHTYFTPPVTVTKENGKIGK
jgi:hypothetical protein